MNNEGKNNNYQNNSILSNTNLNNLYRSNSEAKCANKKLNFKTMKNNTICSLNDVEYFLNSLHHAFRYIKLYKLLK